MENSWHDTFQTFGKDNDWISLEKDVGTCSARLLPIPFSLKCDLSVIAEMRTNYSLAGALRDLDDIVHLRQTVA